MANALGMDIEGKMVVLKKKLFGKSFQSKEARTVLVTGGFGANANTGGGALYVKFLDGTHGSYRGVDVESFVGEAVEIPAPKIQVGDQIYYSSEDKMSFTVFPSTVRQVTMDSVVLEGGELVKLSQVDRIERDRTV